MKVSAVVELILTNAVLLFLYSSVVQDYGLRADYWRTIGFSPSFAYGPVVFVLSAVSGRTSVPGLLTFDWSQFFLIALIIVDGVFAMEAVLSRRSGGTTKAE